MEYNINVDVSEETFERIRRFEPIMGYLAFNIAVIRAPMDTGNLRRSIALSKNSGTLKQIRYNTIDANYITFLEEGIGPVKKHKGFIGRDTVLASIEAIINLYETGSYPFVSFRPTVELKDTDKLFSRERNILNNHNIKSDKISADVRRNISRIHELEYRKTQGGNIKSSLSGSNSRANITRDFTYGSNRGRTVLSKAYTQMKKEVKGNG